MLDFKFRLAGHLKMTVNQLDAEMGSDELRYWIARERIDPIPDNWLMWRWLMSVMSRANPHYKPMSPDDFDFCKKAKRTSGLDPIEIERSRQTFMALAALHKADATRAKALSHPKRIDARSR